MRNLLIAGALTLSSLGAAELKTNQKFYGDDPVWVMPKPEAALMEAKSSTLTLPATAVLTAVEPPL